MITAYYLRAASPKVNGFRPFCPRKGHSYDHLLYAPIREQGVDFVVVAVMTEAHVSLNRQMNLNWPNVRFLSFMGC